MSIPIRRWCMIAPLLCCFGFVAPAGAEDIFLPPGQTSTLFEWVGATGPVVYYYVEVDRSDHDFEDDRSDENFGPWAFRVPQDPDDPTQPTRVLITGAPDDRIRVRVQAMAANGDTGEFSPVSETVHFVAPIVDPCEGVEDVDSDADGTPDCRDACADNPAKTQPGTCGCDSAKIEPGICGCDVSDVDSDGDGTPDCVDGCIDNAAKTEPGTCGCDSAKIEPGICGCDVSDVDSDGDGTPDCVDGCRDDPDKSEPGICGCGVSDIDTEPNGIADCHDAPPDPAELLDFDNDGRAELLIRDSATGEIQLGHLADSSSAGWVQADPLAPSLEIVGNADFDGDGYADLLVRGPTAEDLEIRLLEDGEAWVTGGLKIAASQDVVGSADYDGNGYADILLRDRQTDALQFLSLRGTYRRGVVQLDQLDRAEAEIIGSGDYDRDHRPDILWQDGGDFYIWYLDDPEEEPIRIDKGTYRFLATGDYDGNGFSDLLLLNERSGDLKMELLSSDHPSHEVVDDNGWIPSSWDPEDYSVVGSADFNGDGRCDIALRHTSSGELRLLYMDGPDALGGLSVGIPQAWSVDGVGLENPANE